MVLVRTLEGGGSVTPVELLPVVLAPVELFTLPPVELSTGGGLVSTGGGFLSTGGGFFLLGKGDLRSLKGFLILILDFAEVFDASLLSPVELFLLPVEVFCEAPVEISVSVEVLDILDGARVVDVKQLESGT